MRPLGRIVVTTLVAIVGGVSLVLAACGGGGDEQPDVPTPAVDCEAKPEACK